MPQVPQIAGQWCVLVIVFPDGGGWLVKWGNSSWAGLLPPGISQDASYLRFWSKPCQTPVTPAAHRPPPPGAGATL